MKGTEGGWERYVQGQLGAFTVSASHLVEEWRSAS